MWLVHCWSAVIAVIVLHTTLACEMTTECPAYFICEATECKVNPDNKFHSSFQCEASDSECPNGWHCVSNYKTCFYGNARFHLSSQDCANNKTCPTAYYCDQGTCYLKAAGYPCTSDDQCDGYCLENMCRVPAAKGLCATDNHCPLDYFCKNETCEYAQLTGACTANRQCLSCIRACIQGQCTPIPSATICSRSGDCFVGNYCNRGTCAPNLAIGSACNASYQCTGGATCLRNGCSFKSASGDVCEADSDCNTGFYCANGTCTNQRTSGGCTKGQECYGAISYVCSTRSQCELTAASKDCTSTSQCWNFFSCIDGKCTYSGKEHEVAVTCGGTYDCALGYKCEAAEGTCYKDPTLNDFVRGKSCSVGTDCPEGFQCTDNTCFAANG